MGHKIVSAAGNEGKIEEIRLILTDLRLKILSMKKAGVDLDTMEDEKTFEENAAIKARAIWEKTGGIMLVDDSGLVVDYLDGEPGIYSTRYLGEDTSYKCKGRVILKRMERTQGEERSARFVSAIAAILPGKRELGTLEIMEEVIAREPAGDEGFEYDPIFYLPGLRMTSAEIPIELKNEIGHRGKALVAMKDKIRKAFGGEHQ